MVYKQNRNWTILEMAFESWTPHPWRRMCNGFFVFWLALFSCFVKIEIKSAGIVTLPVGRHTTPASSRCPQLWTPHPPWLHCDIDVSSPTHRTLSSHIWPVPCPNAASPGADKAPSYPSWRQTTWASCKFHESSQMVPHIPLYNTSTRPEDDKLLEFSKRTAVLVWTEIT